MNQKQRDYLTKKLQEKVNREISELEDSIPEAPTMNQYVISDILQGKINLQPIEIIRQHILDKAMSMEKDDALIQEIETSSYSYRRRRYKVEEGTQSIILDADKVFILPEEYAKVRLEWANKVIEINKKIENLKTMMITLEMKIQIGSSDKLEKIVMELDSLGDVSLINAQLALEGPSEKKTK